MNVNGKSKRVGYHTGKTSDWKKAIVTIDTNPEEKAYLAKGGKQTKISKKYKDFPWNSCIFMSFRPPW